MFFVDPLRKVVFSSQYGKEIMRRSRLVPSDTISLSAPHVDSAPLPEMPAPVVTVPEIYEEHRFASVYPEQDAYEQPPATASETSFAPDLSVAPQTMATHAEPEPELAAALEISQAIDEVRQPESIDGLLQHTDALVPHQEPGLEALLDDPILQVLRPPF